jgi:HSP20 family protein
MGEKLKRFILASRTEFGTPWQPPADIYKTRNGWLLKFDLAGVKPDEVAVEAHGRRITVSGLRRDWTREEGCTHYSMEISYNRFQRTIELPCDIQSARIGSEYHDGILTVRIQTEL